MVFAQKVLAPGSQACFLAEKAITKVSKRIFFLDGGFLGRINLSLIKTW
jgi:hypothetical protein